MPMLLDLLMISCMVSEPYGLVSWIVRAPNFRVGPLM